ncbi:alpha/beta fold hydrolase [Chelativorans sp. YIM 93263]|uniref:alpha/beta fold hydrolase n=1 Tax=Chelativorans sp. YIM 93263 TaxID=2906648 RepID=UPI002379DC07|nr:alpha/beta hydrolase [Chelativorans sp. YIM 93263]
MTELLRQIPENPVPNGATAGTMITADSRRIRYACFSSGGDKGTVVLLQGRNECIEKYFETVRDLAARGFSTATFDWRGQGGSERLLRDPRRGYIKSFDQYVIDLDQFFREVVLPDCRPPYSVLAHSTGALVALLAIPDLVNRVRRMTLSAPLLDLPTRVPTSLIRKLANLFYLTGLGSRYIIGAGRRGKPLPFLGNYVTSDADRYARNQALVRAFPDLFIGAPTAAWLRAAFKAIDRVRDPAFMESVRLPILFLSAGADRVVSTPAIERYATGLRSGHVLTINGARHELLQEDDFYREQALAAFEAFTIPQPGNRTEAEPTRAG